MASKPVLVVMAAGMGSRYGGLKQIDPVGSQGEAILDYAIYDAHEAGFETVVIIIKEAIKKDFMETVGKRLEKAPVEIRYAYQEQYKGLPEGMEVPAERGSKPWGTSHAVLCAKEAIGDAPFAVINSDDYYGKSAFKTIYDALCNARDGEKYDYYMVGYYLRNTVSDHGTVARGVCQVDEKGNLASIVERLKIAKYDGGIHFTEDGEIWTDLEPNTLVSMNMFGWRSGRRSSPSSWRRICPSTPPRRSSCCPCPPANCWSAARHPSGCCPPLTSGTVSPMPPTSLWWWRR